MKVPGYADPVKVPESGANTAPGGNAGRGENASPGAALDGGYPSGSAVIRLARGK
jgi:hypothetical protein